MTTCIYCQRTNPACGFTKDHVIPQALGKFEGDVVTLTREVCADCNQYFGDKLEIFLTRDSAEAMFRFRHGLKDPAQVRSMFPRRVRVRLPRDGSRWGGVHLDFVPPPPGEPEPFLDLVPQFGFERKDRTDWEYLTEQEFCAEPDWPERYRCEFGGQRIILYNSPESRQRLLDLSGEHGLPMKVQHESSGFEPFELGRITAELEFSFDKVLTRAVAKIGFNYFAKVQGPSFALNSAFDLVREFIRYDRGLPQGFVQFGQGPVLRDRDGNVQEPRGHIVTVGWDDQGSDIIARVCPFQHLTYVVRLCEAFGGVWRPIDSAHLYDLKVKRAERMVGAKLIQLPTSGPPAGAPR